MKKIISILSLVLCICINAYAADLSDWAQESFNNMSSYGILTKDIVSENMKGNITRAEFCSLLMNIYKCDKRVVLSEKDMDIFDDTDEESILEAYKVGIVSGKGNRIFEPDSPITRQEMAVMLSRTLNLISNDYNKYEGQVVSYLDTFSDSEITAEWALSDIAAICDYGIITGTDAGESQPLCNATREQAICMLDRVYSKFISNTSVHTLPKFKSFDKKSILDGNLVASWPVISGAKEYYIIIKPLNSDSAVITLESNVNSINETYDYLSGYESYSVILGATKSYGVQVFSKPITVTIKTNEQDIKEDNKNENTPQLIKPDTTQETIVDEPAKTEPLPKDNQKTEPSKPLFDETLIHSTDSSALSEKEKRVFPDGVYFATEETAKEYMVEVEVPVWRLHSDGTKSSSISYIEVNKALAEDVVNIFTEIYNDPSQFPIKDVGGYCWRNSASGKISQHSYGTCIDINWNENYYVEPDGTPITGSYWLPGEDPYSIPEDSIVVKTFAKYGWRWGGNAWGESYAKDYMHFTYLGK